MGSLRHSKACSGRNPLIEPFPSSPEGMRVPEVVAVSGHLGWHALKLLVVLPYVLKTMYYARKCVKSIKKNPPGAKKKANEEFFKELETRARKLGIPLLATRRFRGSIPSGTPCSSSKTP